MRTKKLKKEKWVIIQENKVTYERLIFGEFKGTHPDSRDLCFMLNEGNANHKFYVENKNYMKINNINPLTFDQE